ncbi:hypothetical protein GCM10009872_54150 [Actinopolymorpha rutila]
MTERVSGAKKLPVDNGEYSDEYTSHTATTTITTRTMPRTIQVARLRDLRARWSETLAE